MPGLTLQFRHLIALLVIGAFSASALGDHGGSTHSNYGLSVPASSSTGNYTVTWTSSSYLYLEQKLGSGPYTIVYAGTARQKSFTAMPEGTYTYRLYYQYCYYTCYKYYTEPQSIVVNLTPDVPSNIQAPNSDDDGLYSLTWGTVPTATNYPLERRLNGGAWSEIQNTSAASYAESVATNGTYDYRARACNGPSCSAWTPVHAVAVTINGDGGPPAIPGRKPDPGASAASDSIGTIAGTFRVDESGGATYSIPITVAAGTAGVAPEFSLNYSSAAGNGIAGIGWSVGGLSAVTRCRQTYGQDRNPQPIAWSSEDRFCLDGQRLVPHPAGQAYGAPNTTYRTEIDSGAIVTITGSVSGEPDYFEVRRKDGSTSYYGKSPDDPGNETAKYGDGPGKTLTWAIRHFADNMGNPIWYDYEDGGQGHRIREVRWAFGLGRAASAEHGARVEFLYEARQDKKTGYVAGSTMNAAMRLSQIRSYNFVEAWSLIREYTLRYNEGIFAPDKLSRLTSVEECVGNVCLPRTTFTWRATKTVSAASQIGAFEMGGKYKGYTPADINGDGRMDWVWKKGDGEAKTLQYAVSNGTSYSIRSFTSGGTGLSIKSRADAPPMTAIDYNLDGRQDIAYYDTYVDVWKIILSVPTGNGDWKLSSSPITTPLSFPHHDDADVVFTDVDSNGTTDAVYKNIYTGTLRVRKLEVDPTQPVSSSTRYHFGAVIYPAGNYAAEMVGEGVSVTPDFNGDGQIDFVVAGNDWDCNSIYWNCSVVKGNRRLVLADGFATGSPSVTTYANLYSSGWLPKLQTPDVNGDGLSDVFFPVGYRKKYGNSNGFYLQINRGDGTFVTNAYLSDSSLVRKHANPQFVDWNMDGHLDLLWNDVSGSGTVYARYWNPSTGTLDQKVAISYATTGADKERVLFVDANGDSATDLVVVNYNGANGRVRVFTRKSGAVVANAATNRIERITNGLGAATRVTYEPLSSSNHYERLEVDSTTETAEYCDREPGIEEFCYDVPVQVATPASFYSAINGDWDVPDGAQYLEKTSPVLEMAGPMYVVTDVRSDAPAAGASPGSVNSNATSSISYFYKEAKMQAAGRGFLGFERLETVDNQTGVVTTTRYRQDWPFTGAPIGTSTASSSGHLLSGASSTWKILEWSASTTTTARQSGTAALGSIHLVQTRSIDRTFDLVADGAGSGSELSAVTTETSHDIEGNATSITVTTRDSTTDTDVLIVETTNKYDSTYFDRFDGRLKLTTVETSRAGVAGSVTRQSQFQYFLDGPHEGMLWKETIEPLRAEFRLDTEHDYDKYGNRVESKLTGGGEVRCDVVTAKYDDSGRYVDRTWDCLGRLTSEVEARNGFGQPAIIDNIVDGVDTDARVSTYIHYGALGREYFRTSDDGSSQWKVFSTDVSMCPAGSAYKVTVSTAGGGSSDTCFDRLARETRTLTLGFDGQWDAQDTEYDSQGRGIHKSEPFDLVAGTQVAPHWTTLSYDLLGRVTYTDLPGTAWGSNVYSGLETTITNARSQVRTEHRNVLGEIVKVVDNLGGFVDYAYDHIGNLTTVTHNSTVTTSTSFNDLGQKTGMDDPNMGVWSYKYNHFGELKLQTDAESQTSSMTYDGLGRIKTRIDQTASATWTYDTSPNGLGQLDNVLDSQSGYMRAIMYDALGRVDEVTTNFDGGAYFERSTYDANGRVYQVYDAAGDGTFTDSGIVNIYNAYGHVESVSDVVRDSGTGLPRTVYRQINAVNARGQVTDETLGIDPQGSYAVNTKYTYVPETGLLDALVSKDEAGSYLQDLDYDWDDVGNLNWRETTHHVGWNSTTLRETFDYDGLNRLTTQMATNQPTITTTYDLLGNIRTKTGAPGTYAYGGGAGPHAMTSDGASTYYYDENGNNYGGGGRTINWTTFNKPSSIRKGLHMTSFAYGPERARYRRTDANGGETTVTRYVGSVEIIARPDGTVERKRYIAGVTIETGYFSGGNETNRETVYTLKEHLGSTDVIVDEAGAIIQDLSFGPWGQRRDAGNWKELNSSNRLIDLGPGFDISKTTRGFTGHEMLDEVGIIHMNGRIYDPFLGRFLQADPNIQDPTNTQSLNRYSYLLNNPLNATDPSGYFVETLLVAFVVGFIAGEVADALDMPILAAIANMLACSSGDVTGCAAAFSMGSTLGQGGSFSDALKSAAFAQLSETAFQAIGDTFTASEGFFKAGGIGHVGAHAVSGGVLAELQGGKFGHGFASAGISKAANANKILGTSRELRPARIALAATIGGTVSEITGGKFANGAITSGFAQAYNGEGQAAQIEAQKREYGKQVFDYLEKWQQEQNETRQRALDRRWSREMAWSSLDVAGEVLLDSVQRNLMVDLGFEATKGAGVTAMTSRNLKGDVGYDVALSKGLKFKPLTGLSAEVANSNGPIRGFYQSLEFCAVGCISYSWNYQSISLGVAIGPYFGGSFETGYKDDL